MLLATRSPQTSLADTISKQADTIRRHLAQRGYRSQKCSNKPTWKIFVEQSEDFLVLKYSRTSGWTLTRGTTDRQQGEIWQIIQGAIAL